MAGQLLSTSGSAVLRAQPYRRLEGVTVRPARKTPGVPVEGRVHRAWAWVDAIGAPKPFTEALKRYEATRVESFEPSADLKALGVPSLVAEARQAWKRGHSAAVRARLYDAAAALHVAGDELFTRARAMLADAVKRRDEQRVGAITAAVAAMRSDGLVPTVWHDTDAIRSRPLGPWAAEVWLAEPDLWHLDGQPNISARLIVEGRYGAGIFTADETVANLAQVDARLIAADEAERRRTGHRVHGL